MWPGSCYVKLHMSPNLSNATAQSPAPSAHPLQTRPRLSIILLSSGPIEHLDRALMSVLETAFYLETELVVVRACRSDDEKGRLQRLSRQYGFSVELAASGSTRDSLAELGALRATGDIVSVKDDHLAFDSLWLAPFELPAETAVWDSSVVRPDAELADRLSTKPAQSRPPVADRLAPSPRPLGVPKWRADSATERAT